MKVGPRRRGDSRMLVASPKKFIKTIKWKPKFNKLSYILQTSIKWEKKLMK